MGIQINIPGEALRNAGFVRYSSAQVMTNSDTGAEHHFIDHWFMSPCGVALGSYTESSLCMDWNQWGGNCERYSSLLESYGLLALATFK